MDAAPPTSPRSGLLLRLFWTLLAVVVIGYPLSFGPIFYWLALNDLRPAPVWVQRYFRPLIWLSIHAEWALRPLEKYADAWDALAKKHRAARLEAAPATPAPSPVP
jgi:hypothetical protein